jgi:hypothetical protein
VKRELPYVIVLPKGAHEIQDANAGDESEQFNLAGSKSSAHKLYARSTGTTIWFAMGV